MCEDALGDRPTEVPALLRVSRLEDDRLALLRADEVERSDDGKVPALVVEGVLLGGVEELARLAIARECVVLVGVPQRLCDLHELQSSAITRVVVVVLVEAEVSGGTGIATRDDVPPGPTVA